MLRAVILVLLAVALAVPFALRPKQTAPERADDTLVIITPHNEAIRSEYTQAFRTWYRTKTGRTVALDWRNIGGASEIARFLEGEYTASFRNHWTGTLRQPWSFEVQSAFHNGALASTASEIERHARAAFLASDVSCGIDLFFGGGPYDYERQANLGHIVPSEIFERHPEWFTDAVIPKTFSGETFWDANHRWIGTAPSSYGIVFNRDALRRLGIAREPQEWADLADPRYAGDVALADPTKSSSIAKAIEDVVQQQMHLRLAALRAARAPGDTDAQLENRAVREGWLEGLRLLQLIAANSRYFTDTSQKVPIDVADGNCAVGMCIDFYGRQQSEALLRRGDPGRLGFNSARGGTSSSVDPIAILRGAPHKAVAEAFIEFTLSPEGQRILDLKPGTPGGPVRFALRRMAIRRDFYTDESTKPYRSDPDANPFEETAGFVYRPQWTTGLYRELSFLFRVMGQDTHEDLVAAWQAINAAHGAAHDAALARLQHLDGLDYDEVGKTIKAAINSRDKVEELRLAKSLAAAFRARYADAARIARGE